MANEKYDILEFRAVIKPEWTELYILLSQAPDSPPMAGWYKKIIPANGEPAVPALQHALVTGDYFKWDRGAPA